MLKKIEYIIKSFFDGILKQKDCPIKVSNPEPKFKLVDGSRVLLLRQDRIGDVLVSTPLIRNFQQAYPNIEIDILLSDKNISCKRAVDSYVKNIFIYEKKIFKIVKLIKNLRSRRYDIIIDLFDNPSTTSAYLIKIINPLYSLGLDKSNSNIYTHIVPLADKNLVHIVERIANLLLPFGINPSKSNLDIEFRLNPSEIKLAKEEMPESFNKKILGINLSGSSRAKFWGTSNFIDFINRVYMNHSEFEVVIFAMPDYQKELDEILGSTKAVKAPNSNSFTQFASHISACNLILSPDTSVVHLASAFKIPCISLHLWTGTSDTGMPWHSYNAPHKVLKTNTNDLTQILVEDVYTAFEELNKGENL